MASIVCGLLCGAAVFWITSTPGPGLDPDSASYLSAAESLVHGKGYRIAIASWSSRDSTAPLTHFPPGFSTAIAVPISLGASPVQGARIVNAIAAGVTAAAVWLVMAASAGTSLFAAPVTVLVLALTPAIVDVHLSALSEPLFLAFLALTLVALISQPRRPFLAGVFAAGAGMVRYAGVAVVGGVVLWAFLQRDSPGARIKRALVAAAPAIALQGIWVIRSRHVAGPHGIREAGIYGGLGATLEMGRQTIIEWMLPLPYGETLPMRGVLALLLLAAVAVVGWAGARQALSSRSADRTLESGEIAGTTLRACALLALCYVGIVVLSRLFADPGIPFDNRIQAPLQLLLIIAASVATFTWSRGRGAAVRAVIVVVLLAWVGFAIYDDYDTVSYAMSEGSDFASSAWRGSPTLAWARSNAASVPLYSNWAAAVYFHLHRPAHELPETAEDEPPIAFVDTLRSRRGVILAFDAPSPGIDDPAQLQRVLGLRELAKFSDGRILAAPDVSQNAAPR